MAELSNLDNIVSQALLEMIPCAVMIADADGRIVYWSKAAEQLTGYSAEEMAGATCEVLRGKLAASQNPEFMKAICPFHGGPDVHDEEYEIRHKAGHVIPVFRRAHAICDDSGVAKAFVQVLVDVSYIKAANNQIRGLRTTLRTTLAKAGRFSKLVGSSPAMLKLYEVIKLVAAIDASIVIEGETGTGKELVARTIHERSHRADRLFLAVNCGALPETLGEAELFGHVKGAFTGAISDRLGRFEEASGGTLLLDEVSELSPAAQVKLLRVLQEGEITRVGESRPRRVDVRIIAATNRPLAEEIRAGRFREDLYYRLHVMGLEVPPLRDRLEDIPELVEHFIHQFNRKYDRAIENCTPQVLDKLRGHDWPGNVRELAHALEHAFVVTPPGVKTITAEALPPELNGRGKKGRIGPAHPAAPSRVVDKRDEKAHVKAILDQAGGNKSQAARLLGLTRAGLYKKLKRLGLS